jgi:hypothetical protein
LPLAFGLKASSTLAPIRSELPFIGLGVLRQQERTQRLAQASKPCLPLDKRAGLLTTPLKIRLEEREQ